MDLFGPTLRRTRRRERPGWRAVLAIALSLLVNVLVVTQLDARWLGVLKAGPRRDVAIAPLAAADWEANRRILPPAQPGQAPIPAPAARPAEPPRPKETPEAPGQVVQVDESARVKEVAPKETTYVSDRDRTVEKQTRARLVPDADGERPKPAPPPRPAVAVGEGGTTAASAPGAPGAKGPKESPAAEKRVALAPTPAEQAARAALGRGELPPAPQPAGAPKAPTGEGGEGGATAAGEADQRLVLPPSTVAKVLGRAVGDKLDDVEEGDGTFLNTRAWKYATYFNRIKESVGNAWRPNREIQRRDPDGSLYFFKDRLTVLSVTLDDKGGLKDVKVVRSSNVDFLDKIAVEAFEKAQPFSNPPAGLVNDQGEIKYVLGFEVYGARPGLHLYRGPAPQ